MIDGIFSFIAKGLDLTLNIFKSKNTIEQQKNKAARDNDKLKNQITKDIETKNVENIRKSLSD